MEEKKEKVCSGNCLDCTMNQRFFCASQNSHQVLENQRTIIANQAMIFEKLDRLEGSFLKEPVKPVEKGR